MKRRVLAVALTTAIWVVALLVVLKVSLDQLPTEPWGNPMSGEIVARLGGDTQVGQLFLAPLPGLYRIEVALNLPDEGASGPVLLHLKADPSAVEDLSTAEFAPGSVDELEPIGIEFPPVRDSKDRTFFFYLESPESPRDSGPSVPYSPDAVLEAATAYLNGEPVPGNLQFRSYYSLRTRERAALLLERMAEDRPYLLGTEAFYVVVLVVYASVLLLFLYQIGKVVTRESDSK